ncbi:xanthine dehydrogenase small subunit [Thalassobius sp. Cn5-15]|uniref:xanthine dehydrogenase small subunit n=1 Tax=Thalassobius sp. Cn5-15 TaxID=2917763 RepID=UPI001EF2FD0C|nr:xanthine dehydrogenase small subunit [Thalassobius sp. Cn5-15]MCG7493596.1 xanthine dehydrogenase small subunit [Thalassobius sp. Cn5-15]
MSQRSDIRFLLNGRAISLPSVAATDTLLDFLRIDQRLTGSKEGCAEGDCGACTVLVGRLTKQGLRYEAVNACIRFVASLDGCHVVTIEHIRGADGGLHPVQQAMVDHHGSQCGFCTPGIVMSLYALWMEVAQPTARQVEVALQGNLCRCTGYEPIIKAALAVSEYGTATADYLAETRDGITEQLQELRDGARVVTGPVDNQAIVPADLDDFAAVLVENPQATIVAGATDVGLWVTKFLRPISPAIHINQIDALKRIEVADGAITLGAGVSYSDFLPLVQEHFPFLLDYWNRIAGWQVRNMGTVGGNIANGSPIGDTPPVLIALGARVTLRKGMERREVPLEAYFIDYGKQDLHAGEFLESVTIPVPSTAQLNAAYKISKRRDEDISAVAVGISVTVQAGQITDARIAYGGMAATPKRASAAEAALIGRPFGSATFEAAAQAVATDFQPLSDWRASADYRLLSASNLLRRFYMEHSDVDQPVRLVV